MERDLRRLVAPICRRLQHFGGLTAVRKEQKSTSPAQFVAFQQALDAEAIFAASDWMELGDGVKVTTPAAEGHLIGVLNEPLPNVPDDNDDPKTTMFSSLDYEIAFRAKALTVLLTRGTSIAKAAVSEVAKNHVNGELRGHAIQALAYGLSDAERVQLKTQLRPEDERYVYRPHRTDPDFETKVQHYVSTY